jgi:hypothetical protein
VVASIVLARKQLGECVWVNREAVLGLGVQGCCEFGSGSGGLPGVFDDGD